MGYDIRKENECFEKDYEKLYSKGSWNKDEIAMMKDYKKLIYYNLVIDAMQNGGDYPGSEYMPDMRNSYARGRDSMGRFTSGNMSRNMYYPDWDMNMSGRRYYDSEKEKAIHKLHHMMENTDDAERKSALNFAIHELEGK